MEDEAAPPLSSDADGAAAVAREQQAGWIPAVFPGLDPRPVAEVRCVSLRAPWLDDGGDGFVAARRGRVVAFCGSNLMKFGPVLGDRLARTVLSDGVHADLRAELQPAARR